MKTINIHKDRSITNGIFIIVNGKKYPLRYQSLTPPPLSVQFAEDKCFEIRAKHFGVRSPVYTFEPKDNMLLQVSVSESHPSFNLSYGLVVIAQTLVLLAGWFFRDSLFHYISAALFLLAIIFWIIIMRKRHFIIREVNNV